MINNKKIPKKILKNNIFIIYCNNKNFHFNKKKDTNKPPKKDNNIFLLVEDSNS